MIEKKCENCGSIFQVVNSRGNTARFCCKKCSYEFLTGENSTYWKGGISKPKCSECGKTIVHRATMCRTCSNKSRIGKRHLTEEHKQILREMMTGHKYWLGRHHSLESIIKKSEAVKGDKHPNWKGGITKTNKHYRQTLEYKLWRKSVFERDNYTCVWCGKKGGNLHADHIKQFAFYPELRTKLENGRTMCVECHKKTETYKRHIKI